MDYVKIISVDSDNSKIIVDNSDKFDGSDIIEIMIGIENKFLMDYFKVCMKNEMVCNLEVNNDNVLICGFVEVRVERNGDDKFIIQPVIKSKDIPDIIDVDINNVSEKYKEHLKNVLSDSIDEDKSIGVGLVCEGFGNGNNRDKDKWFIEGVQVKFEK